MWSHNHGSTSCAKMLAQNQFPTWNRHHIYSFSSKTYCIMPLEVLQEPPNKDHTNLMPTPLAKKFPTIALKNKLQNNTKFLQYLGLLLLLDLFQPFLVKKKKRILKNLVLAPFTSLAMRWSSRKFSLKLKINKDI